jgi:peptidoglycan/xylan/chitin deacetylase (PgdA/CDA1 family)
MGAGLRKGLGILFASFVLFAGFSEANENQNSNETKLANGSNEATPIIYSGSDEIKEVALTFDDGPHPVLTLQLLEILKRYHVRATFFVLGERVKLYPWTLQKIAEEGHEIGNHSYSHPSLDRLSNEQIENEISRTQEIIKNTIGIEPSLFRPPYGAYHHNASEICGEHQLKIVLWSVDPQDWLYRDENHVYEYVTHHVKNGSIILCHDIHSTTVYAIPQIIESLLEQGYEFKTVSEIFADKTAHRDIAKAQ